MVKRAGTKSELFSNLATGAQSGLTSYMQNKPTTPEDNPRQACENQGNQWDEVNNRCIEVRRVTSTPTTGQG
jgi:hypothetical protein